MQTALTHLPVHGGDLIRSFVFDTMLSANLKGLPPAVLEAEATRPADVAEPARSLRRPVSANAIAQSLGLPYETVRGRVVTLLRLGLCERRRGGLVVPPEVAARPEFEAAMLKVHALFIEAIRTLREINYDFDAEPEFSIADAASEQRPSRGPTPPALVVRMVMDFQLRHLETLVPTFGDVTRGFIWAGILQANIRRLLRAPGMAWTYAEQATPPPDDLRAPVSIRMMSRELGLPYETVRRHVGTLIEEGRLRAIAGKGVIVPAAVLGDDRMGNTNPLLMQRFTRLVADLKRLGFDFADPR